MPFTTIQNCKGKTYVLSVRQSAEDGESAVHFSYEKKVEPGTKFVVNGNDIEGTMIIKTITNRFDLETFL